MSEPFLNVEHTKFREILEGGFVLQLPNPSFLSFTARTSQLREPVDY